VISLPTSFICYASLTKHANHLTAFNSLTLLFLSFSLFQCLREL
jgi:hypothetical protein